MRNRISCSAQTLSQLQPEMIRSVVGGQVFNLGNQYFAESRVHVLSSDSGEVSAEVNGTFGMYSQTIKLRSGVLSTKCSCPSNEKPFCRHCVAVLLQHYQDTADAAAPRQSPSNGSRATASPAMSEPAPESARQTVDERAATSPPRETSKDFNFREVTQFVDWMQEAVGNLGGAAPLPPPPSVPVGAVREWSEAITSLHRRFQESEQSVRDFNAQLNAAEQQIVKLTQDLDESQREAKDAQGACSGLQAEIKRYQDLLSNFDDVNKDRDRLHEQTVKTRDELQRKCRELEDLSKSLSHWAQGLE